MRNANTALRSVRTAVAALGLSALALPAAAATITVDGDLSDWGVTVSDSPGSTPLSNFSSPSGSIGLKASFVEDTNDNAGNNFFLGPNYGGQNYDAEFMGAAIQGNMLYLAIVSGQRPDNGFDKYSPGDIRLSIGSSVYGIEVGGGAGGGSGTAITEGAAGTTYTLNGSGYTTGIASTDSAQTAGSVWIGANWINDPIAPQTPVQMQIDGSSTQVATADYAYTRNSVGNQHSIIELALDMTGMIDEGSENNIGIAWSPACGNDIVSVLFAQTFETEIPEPGSALVWMVGAGAIAGLRYRRKRRA